MVTTLCSVSITCKFSEKVTRDSLCVSYDIFVSILHEKLITMKTILHYCKNQIYENKTENMILTKMQEKGYIIQNS